ncbi:MAG TPA: VIT1/CCC1 transporter family protein [Candidatus Hydrogenedentes bacterium]|nr:VIT1/CCC1 transporter family protein [Candidatus Hydrogenedentota bacterium]HOL76806.1 VIT1/CCC1 transporter family protein [Candidatus Hydrogenedentota bacterium]HPO85717.1 VIT1/CCC1 transporter family protein [Candidatus Hydrogenedentota bacterium]
MARKSDPRLKLAQEGFAKRDKSTAAAAHAPEKIADMAREEHGGTASQYLGEMVYGGLDGIITTFAVVSGVAGADLGAGVVLILGLANLFADGFSMATGAYLSLRSEQEYYDKEREREQWEIEHFPEGERTELLVLYREQGYSEEEAQQMVAIKTREPKRWLDAMMLEELELLRDDRVPLLNALATFVAFIVAGSVPLLVYLLGLVVTIPPQAAFPTSLILSAVALFVLGAAKVLVTRRNPWRSGLEMLLVGALAAGVAYGVGVLLRGLGTHV